MKTWKEDNMLNRLNESEYFGGNVDIKRLSFDEGVAFDSYNEEIMRFSPSDELLYTRDFRSLRRKAYEMGYRYEVMTHFKRHKNSEGYFVSQCSINYYKDKEMAESVAKEESAKAHFDIKVKKLNPSRTSKKA